MLRSFIAFVLLLSIAGSAFAKDGPGEVNKAVKKKKVKKTDARGVPGPIFDGKTFKGWEGNMEWFRIEDGAVVAGTMKKRIPRNEFLCTKKKYSDFDLRLKVKLLGGPKANAGIQFRTKRIPNHHEVSGFQADMGGVWWGKLYDESRRRKMLAGPDAKTKLKVNEGGWNDYRILAEGNHIQMWLNGVKTVDYVEKEKGIDRDGIIGLQIHSGIASEAWYKDIKLLDLSK